MRLAANDGQAIINELIYGSVSGKKLDDAGNALEGALIGLFTTDEGEFNEETAVLTTTSAEDGSFHFENIPKGIWYIREIRRISSQLRSLRTNRLLRLKSSMSVFGRH